MGSWQQTLSYYNPLHRKGHTSPPVYSRDFAYEDNGPVVLAHPMREERADINGTSAKTFAEYVHDLSFYSVAIVGMHGAFSGHAEPVASVVGERA